MHNSGDADSVQKQAQPDTAAETDIGRRRNCMAR
jgi:hypothetical protein